MIRQDTAKWIGKRINRKNFQNSKVCRLTPNYAECRTCALKGASTVRRGAEGKGPLGPRPPPTLPKVVSPARALDILTVVAVPVLLVLCEGGRESVVPPIVAPDRIAFLGFALAAYFPFPFLLFDSSATKGLLSSAPSASLSVSSAMVIMVGASRRFCIKWRKPVAWAF